MNADRFRLAVFVLAVVVVAAMAWAFQWRYVTGERGALLRFNRFTGSEEVYVCQGAPVANGAAYLDPGRNCRWLQRWDEAARQQKELAKMPPPPPPPPPCSPTRLSGCYFYQDVKTDEPDYCDATHTTGCLVRGEKYDIPVRRPGEAYFVDEQHPGKMIVDIPPKAPHG